MKEFKNISKNLMTIEFLASNGLMYKFEHKGYKTRKKYQVSITQYDGTEYILSGVFRSKYTTPKNLYNDWHSYYREAEYFNDYQITKDYSNKTLRSKNEHTNNMSNYR